MWSTGDSTRVVQVTGTGWYVCTLAQGACRVTDSVYVVMPIAPPSLILNMPAFCAQSDVLVPVLVSNVSHFGALSMVLQYDTARLSYLSIQDVQPQLQGATLITNNNQNRFYLAWYNVASFIPAAPTTVLFQLRFRVRSVGTGQIAWVPSLTELADSVGNVYACPVLTAGSFTAQTCGGLGGQVRYLNSGQTPMTNTTLQLWQGQQLRYTAAVQSTGEFDIPQTDPGLYTLSIQTSKPWGGVNATDALLVSRHFTNLLVLTGLNYKAADVNGSGLLNSTDALNISRRFAVITSNFSVGDWALAVDTISLGGSGTRDTLSLGVLCYGDVNGSYFPSLNLRTVVNVPNQNAGILLFGNSSGLFNHRINISYMIYNNSKRNNSFESLP